MKITMGSLLEKDKNTEPVSRPLKNNECNIDMRFDEKMALEVYSVKSLAKIAVHCSSQGYRIVNTMREALLNRDAGIRSMTLREADIAARAVIDLKPDSTVDFLLMNGSLLIEGIVGDSESGFELRRRYNRGKQWFAEFRDKVDAKQIAKAQSIMIEIIDKLNSSGLHLWPEELDGVFHNELLRPEFMTDGQYMDATRKKLLIKDA